MLVWCLLVVEDDLRSKRVYGLIVRAVVPLQERVQCLGGCLVLRRACVSPVHVLRELHFFLQRLVEYRVRVYFVMYQ